MANDSLLRVTLTADARPLTGVLRDSAQALDTFAGDAERSGQRFAAAMADSDRALETVNGHLQRLEGLGRAAGGQLAALGRAGVGALRDQARQLAETEALAQALGLSATKLQEWQYAGQQVGLQASQVGEIFTRLQTTLGELGAGGDGAAAGVFAQLNLDLRELQSLDPDAQLQQITEAIARLDDPAQRTHAFETLAEGASRLNPLLQAGGLRLRTYSEEARTLGVALSGLELADAAQADRALRQVGAAVEGLGNQLLVALGPSLAAAADGLSGLIRDAGGMRALFDDLVTTGQVLASLYAGHLAQSLATYATTALAANGASLTLTGTLRALRGVMATAFGPLGVVVAAAGVLYTFREELGLVPTYAKDAADEVDLLTGSIEGLSRAQLENKKVGIVANLVQAQTEAATLQKQIDDLQKKARSESIQFQGRPGAAAAQLSGVSGSGGLTGELKKRQAAIEANQTALAQVNQAIATFGETSDAATPPAKQLNTEIDDGATAARNQANALQALQDRLDPVAASQRAFQTDTQTLNQSVAMGLITFDRYFDLVDNLQHAYQNSGDAAQAYSLDASQAAKTATRETSVLSRTLDQMVAGLDDTFQGFWQRLLGGAKISFEGLKTQAISALAEIIHAYTTKRIVASLGLSVGGSLAGTGSAAAGGTGGGGMGGFGGGGGFSMPSFGMPSFDSLSGAWTTAQNAWAGFNGTYGASLGTQGGISGTAIGSANAVVNGTGIGGASNTAFGAGTTTAGLTAAITNAIAYYAAYQGGGMVGNKIGTSLTGKTPKSNIGQMLGTVGGSFWGVPGAFVGSTIGSMVDSIFGSSRKYTAGFESFAETPDRSHFAGGTPYYSSGYYRDGDLGRGRETPFGSFGFTDKTKFEPSDMIDLLDALAALDQTLASAANDTQIESVKNALDGWQTRLKNDSLGELVARRYAVVSETLEKDASEATAKLIERVGEITADSAERTIPQLAQALQLGNLIDGLSGNVKTYAEKVVDDTNTSLEDAFSQITAGVSAHAAVSAIADELNLTFDDMGERAVEAALNLQQLAGGLDALQANAQTYYANFFSAEEQRQRAIDQIAPTLEAAGLSAESTRAQFRAVVESLDLNTESGRQTYSELMSVAGAFAQLSESAADAAKRAEEIERQRWSLQNDLLRAQGNSEAALARERQRQLEQMPETLRALQQEVWAIDARNQAAAAAAEKAEAAAKQQALLQRTALYRDGTVGAVDGLIDRYQRAMEVAQAAADERQRQLENEKRALATIGDMRDAMRLSDQSILSPAERLAESRRQFAALQVRAEAGDTDALSQLGQAKNIYLTAAGDYYGQASAPYAAIYTEIESALSGLEDQYNDSIHAQGSLENVQRQVLEAQRQARNTLLSSLEQQVQQSTQLQSIADLVSLLPPSLADSLSAILPTYATDVGESAFDAAAYLSHKTDEVNAKRQEGRADWTPGDVYDRILKDYGSLYAHYQQIGRDEGVSPTYQSGEDTVSHQTRRFDEDTYVANQVAYLNDRDRGERTWSSLQFYMALDDANLSAYEHWLRYGQAEGVSAYARDSAEPSVSRAEARPVVATYSARRASTDDGQRTVSETPLWDSATRAGVDVAPVVAELRALRRDNAELRARLDALVDASSDTAAHTRATAAHSQRTADGIAENNRRSRTSQRMPA